MGFYDNLGFGGSADPAIAEARRSKKEMQKTIAQAAANNYNNSPEYYDQIKALALTQGIPVPPPRGDLARTLGGAAINFLTAGMYNPMPSMTEAGRGLQGAAGFASWLVPWGTGARLGGAALKGVTGAIKGVKGASHPMIKAFGGFTSPDPIKVNLLTKAGKSKAVSTIAKDPNVIKGAAEIAKKEINLKDPVAIKEAMRDVFGAKNAYNENLYQAVFKTLNK
tara:strand:+ start:7062 stop:7730 length:669 start_codon:yes stop_codon:yes gene_type:complete